MREWITVFHKTLFVFGVACVTAEVTFWLGRGEDRAEAERMADRLNRSS